MPFKFNVVGSGGWRSKRGLIVFAILLVVAGLLVWVFVKSNEPEAEELLDPEAYSNSINTSEFATKNIEENANADDESKTALYLTRAAKYAEEGEYSLALEDYLFVDERTETKDYNMTLTIAVIAQKAGETNTARDYYNRAKQELSTQDPNNTQVMDSIDQKLSELGDG